MNAGEQPFGEERRDAGRELEQHVAQVWAASIADHDANGLFRLGTVCLEVAESTPDADRRRLLSSVALALLVQAGSEDEAVGGNIGRFCVRERTASERHGETTEVIAALSLQFGEDGRPRDGLA